MDYRDTAEYTAGQLRGAESLIRDGLQLSTGHTMLLLTQRELTDVCSCIEQVAHSMGVRVETKHFDRKEFSGGFPRRLVPDEYHLNPVPSGIALLIEWSEPTTGGRLSLLKSLQEIGQPWRIASMPGVRLDNLHSCVCDLDAIKQRCMDCFALLARSRQCHLSTVSPWGGIDTLEMPIGQYCPVSSTGSIPEGAWGNFPSGETFVLPNPYQSSGIVTLRGSVPNYVLKKDEWVRFAVERGRLKFASLEASSSALKAFFAGLFFRRSGSIKHKNSNTLAELGIGTNQDIKTLTGMPIFDEKKLNTVHIAFGSNSQFYGRVESRAHHDITITGADLSADEEAIVKNGKYLLTPNSARPALDAFAPSSHIKGNIFLSSRPVSYADERGSSVMRVDYAPHRGRPVSVTIAEGETAKLATSILENYILREGSGVSEKDLLSTLPRDERVPRILRGLLAYGVLENKS